MKISADILKKAKNVQIFASDIDGVLTGGEIVILGDCSEIKIWNVRDGLGYSFMSKVEPKIITAWITGRESDAVKARAESFEIDYLIQGCADKNYALETILKETGCKISQVAYIGDDIIDIPVLKKAGFSVCPKDACDEVKEVVDFVSSYNGGKGVARETIEIILKAKGEWDKILKKYGK